MYDILKPFVLKDSIGSQFALGWSITVTAGFLSYPLDTLSKRMMMTAVDPVKHATSYHLLEHIIRTEGVRSLFGGAWFNILRSMGGALLLVASERSSSIIKSQASKLV
jgi:solute carrier family 25 (mitochondrial adenine nucleotide translocator), member 4/5/6/31